MSDNNGGGQNDNGKTSDDSLEAVRHASPVNVTGTAAFSVRYGRPYSNTLWAYRFAVDQDEVLRLDRVHYLLKSLPDLYRGPVDEVLNDQNGLRRLLDVGCGTGCWLIEMAARFPHVDCVGIDWLQFQHSSQLQNVTFMRVDIPQGMSAFADESFDVVHIRQMDYAILDYRSMLRQAHRVLRYGGLILIHEHNFQCYSVWRGYSAEALVPALAQWSQTFRRALSRSGIDIDVFNDMEGSLEATGFQRAGIDVYFHYRPMCPCEGGDEARHDNEATRAMVSASRATIIDSGELSVDAFDALEANIARELMGESTGRAGPLGGRGVFSPWGFWWARKA